MGILRIMSVGKSGVGKSTIGNILLFGKPKGQFRTSTASKSCTQTSMQGLSNTGECMYTDVPGIPDTDPTNTAKFYDVIIEEAKKPLTVILFVFKRDREDPAAYKLAEMLFRELNKSNAAKILVINDQNSYGKFNDPPTEAEYEDQAKRIAELTKIEFSQTLVVTEDTMLEKIEGLKIMLSKMNEYTSEHLKNFTELREYVEKLRNQKNYEEEVVREERQRIINIKKQLEELQDGVIIATTLSVIATVTSFFTLGATLGLGTPTALAAAAATTAIQIKKAELEAAEKKISTENVEKAAKELKDACDKFEELEKALNSV